MQDDRTYLLEYSLVTASVVSIGHLSTTALAGITLGSMTASVSGLSIMQGMSSVLDTMLPSAWTSPQPQLVGLWCQRMGKLHLTSFPCKSADLTSRSFFDGLDANSKLLHAFGELVLCSLGPSSLFSQSGSTPNTSSYSFIKTRKLLILR